MKVAAINNELLVKTGAAQIVHDRNMRILVLGGTIFVGRHFVENALLRGHVVTLLHRGQRGADLFPNVDRILADRDGGLSALGNREWDAVVDCCGYVPRIVRQSAQAFANRTARYLFVSTVSIYKEGATPGADESAPVGTVQDTTTEEITGETYGPLKALCEKEVVNAFGDRAFVVRPGLIMGPYDPTNRFTYWADRIGNEDRVLIPDLLDQPLQLIDARDLAAWMLDGLNQGLSGPFNACGPDSPRTFQEALNACLPLNPDVEFVKASTEELETNGVTLWTDLPLAIARGSDFENTLRLSNRKALEAGLKFRPWEQTARDVLQWVQGSEPKPKASYGMSRDKELEVIAKLQPEK